MIFHQRVNGGFAGSPAHRENAEFASERDQALKNESGMFRRAIFTVLRCKIGRRQFAPGPIGVFGIAQAPLAFAVVAHAAGLQNRGQADVLDRAGKRHAICDRGKLGGGDAQLLKEPLFVEAILGHFESGGRWEHGNAFGKEAGGFDGHVLEFIGDQLQPGGKFRQRGAIGKRRCNAGGDASYRSFRGRIQETEMKTQRIAGQGEHVAELSAAKDADGHERVPFFPGAEVVAIPSVRAVALGSGLARTRSVCALRNLRYASRTCGCLAPSMAAASRAALIAPALPMAMAPTGTPPGIWAIERSESRPFRAFDSTGTPSTGSTVFEAVMPGRWAAPPAPAMMTSMPRFSADEA